MHTVFIYKRCWFFKLCVQVSSVYPCTNRLLLVNFHNGHNAKVTWLYSYQHFWHLSLLKLMSTEILRTKAEISVYQDTIQHVLASIRVYAYQIHMHTFLIDQDFEGPVMKVHKQSHQFLFALSDQWFIDNHWKHVCQQLQDLGQYSNIDNGNGKKC